MLLVLGLSIGVVVGATARASRTAAAKARDAVKLAPIGEGVDLDAAPAPRGPAPFDYAAYDELGAELRLRAGRRGRTEPEPLTTPAAWPDDAPIEIPTHEDPSGQLVIELGDDAAAPSTARGSCRRPTC